MTDKAMDWLQYVTDSEMERIRPRRKDRRFVDVSSAQSIEKAERNKQKRRRVIVVGSE